MFLRKSDGTQMNIEVKFQPKNDRDVFLKDERVIKIVSLLLVDDTSIYRQMINIINSTYNYKELDHQLSKLVPLYGQTEIFWKYCIFLEQIYKDRLCSNLRGALLEKFVYELLKAKYYSPSCLEVSCFVFINEWKSKKTVDVITHSDEQKRGECFECKVNPHNIEEEHIDNLKEIYTNSERIIRPSFASFAHLDALELQIQDLKTPCPQINLYGVENLKNISHVELNC
jgi:hypothetical protein